MDDQASFVRYAKHTPRLQRQQLLLDLIRQYTDSTKTVDISNPSIQRFHGALLFVDISGFTALSQKLNVESLKNYINDYFSKMMGIVEKWEGDVVKFAGDAIYIVWPTEVSGGAGFKGSVRGIDLTERAKFVKAAQKQLEKAVACALEISSSCSQYEVALQPSKVSKAGEATSLVGRLLPMFGLGGSTRVSPSNSVDTADISSADVCYLNVHVGVSAGMMAGIDIIHDNRSEYFLIGDPLVGVSMAESQADAGDVVMCPLSHDLLHGKGRSAAHNMQSDGEAGETVTINLRHACAQQGTEPCGCRKTTNGLFRVSKMTVSMSSQRSPVRQRRGSKILNLDAIHEQNVKLYEDIRHDIERMLLSCQADFKREFLEMLRSAVEDAKELHAEGITHENIKGLLAETSSKSSAKVEEEKKFAVFLKSHLKQHFLNWMSNAMLDSMARHAHEVVRTLHNFTSSPASSKAPSTKRRSSAFADVLTEALNKVAFLNESSIEFKRDVKGDVSPELDETISAKVKAKSPKHHSERRSSISLDVVSDGEIRSVVTMFIKIDRFDLQLFVDSIPNDTRSKVLHNNMPFLARTDAERHADQTLLERLQTCYAVLCGTIMEHGGQLRQFIVDDKGTVCIGTFGLRGSAAVDNAATAVEAARRIIQRLSSMELTASIGITSGKAYCGLVGSTLRHEYAVMGPSTNLSARLMCKAPPNGIICDLDIKERDRTHKYHELQAVNAKGYAKPVMTFRPAFDEISASTRRGGFGGPFRANMSVHLLGNRAMTDVKEAVADVTPKGGMHPALDRLLAASRSDFYVVEPKMRVTAASTTSSCAQKLHGREEELMEIFSFLFTEDVQSPQHLSYQDRTKMMVVSGPSGSGKTALLLATEKKLISMSRCDHRQNTVTYMYRANVLNRDVSFSAGRAILTKMLRTVHRAMAAKETRPVRNFDKIRNSQDYGAMIEGLWPKLPEEFQGKKSALALMIPMLGEAPDDERRSAYITCIRVAAALITVMAQMLKRLMVVLIEDLNMLDDWSFHMLHCVWKESQGVVVLTTSNTDDEQSLPTWTELEQGSPIDEASNLTANYFSRFKDDGWFRILPIPPLTKEATLSMAKDVLALRLGAAAVDPFSHNLTEVCEASGGKPLYVVELVKSLTFRSEQDHSLADCMAPGLSRSAVAIGASYRIEEAICVRLDKLHLSLQVLLKAAAVACSYSGSFTLDMLLSTLAGNPYFCEDGCGTLHSSSSPTASSPSMKRKRSRASLGRTPMQTMIGMAMANNNSGAPQRRISFSAPFQTMEVAPAIATAVYSIAEAILELLTTESFIKIRTDVAGSDCPLMESKGEASAPTLDQIHDASLEFVIPLEQNVISGLIVDEQREYFHEHIALFLHTQNIVKSCNPISMHEEGFHWEQAGLWNRAMVCYGKTAALLRTVDEADSDLAFVRVQESATVWNNHGDALMASLQMFQYMQSDAMSTVVLDGLRHDIMDDILHFLLNSGKQYRMIMAGNVTVKKCLEKAMEVVERDVFCLIPAFRMHLHLAEHYLKAWEGKDEIVYALQVALVFAIAARWHEEEMRTQYEEVKATSEDDLLQRLGGEDSIYIPDNDLVLQDEDMLLLLSLCVYCSQILHLDDSVHPLSSSPHHLDRFLESGRLGGEARVIQAQILLATHQLGIHRTQRAISHVELVLASYMAQPKECSRKLAQRFGIDLVPFLLASLSQRCILQADLLDGRKFWSRALGLISDDTIGDAFSWFVAATSMLASCQLMSNGRAEMLRVLAAQGERSAAAQELSVAHGMGPHLRAVCVLWLTLGGDVHVCVEAAEMAAREQQQARRVEELSRLEPLVASEASGPRAAFLQAQGCSLHRVYAESYLVLFAALKESQLNVRIINSMMPLLQLPTEPAGSNYLNVVHVLVYLGTVAAESSGGVLVAVKERSEQNMHHLMVVLMQRGKHLAALTLAEAVLLLPLHNSMRDQYTQVVSAAKSRDKRRKHPPPPQAQRVDSCETILSCSSGEEQSASMDDGAWLSVADRILMRSA